MNRFLMWGASMLVVAAPAGAQQVTADAATTATAPAAPVAAAAPAAAPKKVCKTYQVTGRRISKRVCYTADQWAELDRARSEAAKKLVNDMNSASGKSNLGSGSSGALGTGSLFGLGQ